MPMGLLQELLNTVSDPTLRHVAIVHIPIGLATLGPIAAISMVLFERHPECVARKPLGFHGSLAFWLENPFVGVADTELPTPPRKRGGVLLYGAGPFGLGVKLAKSPVVAAGFAASPSTQCAIGFVLEAGAPMPTPTVAPGPPAATLSDSLPLGSTPPRGKQQVALAPFARNFGMPLLTYPVTRAIVPPATDP